VQQAATSVYQTYPIDNDIRCGVLGYNDSKVVLHTAHNFGGGSSFKYLTDHLLDAPGYQVHHTFPTITDLFPPELLRALPLSFLDGAYDSNLARFPPRSPLPNPGPMIGKGHSP
jgi:hypothetical protein